MAKLNTDTWVLVADSEKALFLRNHGDDQDPHFKVVRKEEQENPKAQDWAANRPGRMPDTGHNQVSALDDTDWHELEKERFAKDLADILYAQAHKGRFDKIAIVADPSVLGNLRPALHQEVSNKIIAEVPKNLTGMPMNEIEDHVKTAMKDAA